MSTLSADFESTTSTRNLRNTVWTGLKRLGTAIGNRFVKIAEAVYEARKEEVRLRAYYHL